MPASENAQSLKVLDELMQKLTISKEADEIKAASIALASFINGRIEDVDTPTKYVLPLHFFLNFFSVAFFFFFFSPLLPLAQEKKNWLRRSSLEKFCGAARPIKRFGLSSRD